MTFHCPIGNGSRVLPEVTGAWKMTRPFSSTVRALVDFVTYTVTWGAGADATERELIAFARERLAHYKCPTSVALVDALPKSASGKILKRELRAMDWSQQGHAK